LGISRRPRWLTEFMASSELLRLDQSVCQHSRLRVASADHTGSPRPIMSMAKPAAAQKIAPKAIDAERQRLPLSVIRCVQRWPSIYCLVSCGSRKSSPFHSADGGQFCASPSRNLDQSKTRSCSGAACFASITVCMRRTEISGFCSSDRSLVALSQVRPFESGCSGSCGRWFRKWCKRCRFGGRACLDKLVILCQALRGKALVHHRARASSSPQSSHWRTEGIIIADISPPRTAGCIAKTTCDAAERSRPASG